MSATPSQLVTAGHRPKTTTTTFEVNTSEVTQAARDAGGSVIYSFPITTGSKLDVRFDLGGFSTQAVEPNVTLEENKVTWSEGISLSTGEAPTVLTTGAGAGVPVFSHEFAIVEGADEHCFKLGVVPRLNQVSRYVHDVAVGTRVDGNSISWADTTADNNTHAFSTTCQGTTLNGFVYPHAAPHYGKVLQQFAASLPSSLGFKFTLACASTATEVDCLDNAQVDFSPPSFYSTTVSAAGSVSFRMLNSDVLVGPGGSANSPDFGAVLLSFLACGAWFPAEIVSFLNYQLGSVVDSKFDSAAVALNPNAELNACYTTGRRPSNRYRFDLQGGRVQLVRTGGSEPFSVYCNVHAAGTHAYHSVQDPAGAGAGGSANTTPAVATAAFGTAGTAYAEFSGAATCPTGCPANPAANLWCALGFAANARSAAAAFEFTTGVDLRASRTVVAAHGLRAPSDCAGTFEASLEPAHYTAQTLAEAVGGVMNQYRGGTGAPAVSTSLSPHNAPTAAFTFVDSTGVSRTAVIGAGYRTPHQLAEAVGFVLNRLDARGVYAPTAENFTVHDGDARIARQQRGGDVSTGQRLLWYRVVYDKVARKYAFENREIASYKFSSFDSSLPSEVFTYPPGGSDGELLSSTAGIPVVQYPAGEPVRAAFSINFKSSDLRNASASVLGMTPTVGAAARLLGFVAEHVYSGTRVVSEVQVGAAHRTLLTQGLLDDSKDVAANCQRPLGAASIGSTNGPYFYHNRVGFRGSGPDSHVHPRLSYTTTGSPFNDQRYTIVATHPACGSSAAIHPIRVTSAPHVYSNNVTATAVLSTGPANTLISSATTAPSGTNYALYSLFALGDTALGATTASALAVASDVDETGAVEVLTVLYPGDGTDTLTTAVSAYQACADGPLRIVDGSAALLPFSGTVDGGDDCGRVIVQCALAVESPGVYRSTQGALPFQVGDVVELGPNASILAGADNLGVDVLDLLFAVERVSAAGAILQGNITFTGVVLPSGLETGQHFRIMQGACLTVIKLLEVTDAISGSCTFEFVTRGTGHFFSAGVPLFGPVPMYITGVVEEVMQVSYRHEGDDVPGLTGAFCARKTHRDVSNPAASFTSASYGRDGALVKVRLANHCKFTSESEPSNLAFMRLVETPRFQLVNRSAAVETGFIRTDTVWNMFGCEGDSAIGSCVKMIHEWDLQAGAGIIVTLESDVGVANLHEFVARGRSVRNVLAKIDYNSALSRSWGVVQAREYTARNLQEIRLRFLDKYLRDYDFMGRSFTIQFNVHSF